MKFKKGLKYSLNKKGAKRQFLEKDIVNKSLRINKGSGRNPSLINSKFGLLPQIYSNIFLKLPGKLSLCSSDVSEIVEKTIEAHNKMLCNYGVFTGTKRWKKITQHAVLLLEGRQPEAATFSTGKSDSWPTVLSHLRVLRNIFFNEELDLEIRAHALKLFNTLIKLNKVCQGQAELDLESIKYSFKIPVDIEEDFTAFLESRLGKQDVIKNLSRLRINSLSLGPANGPNGVDKLSSAAVEAQMLTESNKLYSHFENICSLTGNSAFNNYMKTYSYNSKDKSIEFDESKDYFLRKLTAIPDRGNKSRIVAICDIWTQTALAPLEREEIRMLKENFSEHSAFFDHSQGFDQILTKYDENWKSIDATAWTDNFPQRLQYLYLKFKYGNDFAYSWQQLVVKCDWNVPNSDVTVKYGKGQGMGTKGSFIIASVTDHLFIEMILNEYQILPDYMKVGDDLVAFDPEDKLMSAYDRIGVPINLAKSKFAVNQNNWLEFVSRNAWNNIDVSSISPSLLNSVTKQPLLFPTLLEHLNERSGLPLDMSIFDLIEKLEFKNEHIRERELERIKLVLSIYSKLNNQGYRNIPGYEVPKPEMVLKVIILLSIKLFEIKNTLLIKNEQSCTNLEYGESIFNDLAVSNTPWGPVQQINADGSPSIWDYASDRRLNIRAIELLQNVQQKLAEDDFYAVAGYQTSNLRPIINESLDFVDVENNQSFLWTSSLMDAICIQEARIQGHKIISESNPRKPDVVGPALISFLKTFNSIVNVARNHEGNLEELLRSLVIHRGDQLTNSLVREINKKYFNTSYYRSVIKK